jgi:predicted DNA-binding protein (MmcQ/YjbR family)
MTLDEIRNYCRAFPQATENLQWGENLCFKISGKIFAIVALAEVPQKVCFKCTPEKFGELIEREDIRPAPYVGRYSWVLLDRLDAIPRRELEDLIGQSYGMVAAKGPKTGSRRSRKGGPARPEAAKAGSRKSPRAPKKRR